MHKTDFLMTWLIYNGYTYSYTIVLQYFDLTEFPVQMYWCGDTEVDKERLCQQDAGPDLQYGETHRPDRKRGTYIHAI